MRWNCPHCESLVTAGIDFENIQRAYVRCGKCKGMALIHRSAALAGYVKARRLEDEAQLEAELAQRELKTREAEWKKAQDRSARELALAEAASNEARLKNEAAIAHATLELAARSSRSDVEKRQPPEFQNVAPAYPTDQHAPPAPNERMIQAKLSETAASSLDGWTLGVNQALAEPPRTPPAFLLRANEHESVPFRTDAPEVTPPPRKRFSAGIAIWVAAALAVTSGVYLLTEARKALETPSAISSR
ncbi:MAG: hypothetical protein H7301_02770 [Cryobacterium sp.]|nr:hypothetical protein [Oligoflexia bacterium]